MIGYNAESSAEFLKAWHVPGGVVHLKRLPTHWDSTSAAQEAVELLKPRCAHQTKTVVARCWPGMSQQVHAMDLAMGRGESDALAVARAFEARARPVVPSLAGKFAWKAIAPFLSTRRRLRRGRSPTAW